MAHTILNNFLTDSGTQESAPDNTQRITLQNDGQSVDLPDASYVRDASITRDGVDLVLETADGTVVIEGYYAAEPTPNLVAPDGLTLTPDLVNSFTHGGNQYADAGMGMSDVSPIGAVQEISGEATVTRLNGSVEVIGIGTPIYQGDVIDTDEEGAVNIIFVDDTTFAVSEDARLSIDEYVFDASTQSGVSNFSVLKGVFVFTSGLIGRDDPDDVMIDTPSGSIGIRGTIIAGDVNTGEITVIEGAIVLHDFSGNTVTLSNQYETARFNALEGQIEHVGDLSANDVITKFMSVSTVSADLFSSIQDSATETGQDNNDSSTQNEAQDADAESSDTQETEGQQEQEAAPETSPEAALEGAQEEASLEEVITSEDITQSGESDTTETQSDTTQSSEQDNSEPQTTGSSAGSNTGTQDTQTFTPPAQAELAAPTFAGLAPNISGLDNFFSGSQDSNFSYNFSHEFNDPDSAITGYNLVAAPVNGDIASYNLNTSTGFMSIDLDNLVTGSSTFSFTVEALSDSGNVSHTYIFDIYGSTTTTTPIFVTNDVYSGTDASINVVADNVAIFADGDSTSNIIDINANNSYVKAGEGADTINVSAGQTGHHLYGDAGNDTFNIAQAQGKSYGGDGDDEFILLDGSVVSDFETLSAGLKIDGGVGDDLVQLATIGNIDFSAVNAGLINNIEKIAFINGQTNVISLDYNSVISMTDADNRLVIDMDSADTLSFANSGNAFTHTGLDVTSSYDVYTDGTVTLLVDLDHSAVSGII